MGPRGVEIVVWGAEVEEVRWGLSGCLECRELDRVALGENGGVDAIGSIRNYQRFFF